MEAIATAVLHPQVFILAVIGFIAFYSSCSVGIRAGWLAYHPSVCGTVGAFGGAGLGLLVASV
ncbi:hypothetical protein TVNIR_1781 [Thioalkalivibrio nitratireducens DSM 14787]|uniref:Uncharacterized protein n=1 Tax=Thioalkalivibrio nitratireducens (strain DSM 14787 / UNIQEM 213 / ALEN2) TaxID=1255043 RepID=L0DWM9_THIND|nr:hypothetical protein [Thioalkalivibrio nitratireducens]AGA33443.1 hypothetical protein TVNIR_1781 [Thioalkalivibrio nitratireducens DSM 14787]